MQMLLKKDAKLRHFKTLKTIQLLLKSKQCPLSNIKGDSLDPEAGKTQITKTFKKLSKKCKN